MTVNTDTHQLPTPLLRAIDYDIAPRSTREIRELFAQLPAEAKEQVLEGLALIELAKEKFGPLAQICQEYGQRPEHARLPYSHERQTIQLEDCVVLTKSSVLEYDMAKMGKSETEVLEWYRQQGYAEAKISAIRDSDREQKASLQVTQQLFERAGIEEQHIFILDKLSPERTRQLVAQHPVVISLGGDDHTKAVSAYVGSENYFCVVNSDAMTSTGALTYFTRNDLRALFERLAQGNFLLEEWPRLEVSVTSVENGKQQVFHAPPSLSEISIADQFSLYAFRGTVDGIPDQAPQVVKGSGLIITNGAGSTGWFSASGKYIYPEGRKYLRGELHGEFIVREPYGEKGEESEYTAEFGANDILLVRTSSKHNPEISGDSVWKVPLPAGAEARISLSREPIKIISNLLPEN